MRSASGIRILRWGRLEVWRHARVPLFFLFWELHVGQLRPRCLVVGVDEWWKYWFVGRWEIRWRMVDFDDEGAYPSGGQWRPGGHGDEGSASLGAHDGAELV